MTIPDSCDDTQHAECHAKDCGSNPGKLTGGHRHVALVGERTRNEHDGDDRSTSTTSWDATDGGEPTTRVLAPPVRR